MSARVAELTAGAGAVRARHGGPRRRSRPRPGRATTRSCSADGTIEGFVGGQCAEESVRDGGAGRLRDGEPLLLRVLPDGGEHFPESPSARVVVNPCLSGGALEIFLEPMLPAPLLAVVGSTPIADALVMMAGPLGLRRPPARARRSSRRARTAVVVATHGRGRGARRSGPRSTPASASSGWSPARSAARQVLAAIELTDERAGPGPHPGRAGHRRPHRRRRSRCRSWPSSCRRYAGTGSPRRRRAQPADVPQQVDRPGLRHDRGGRAGHPAPTATPTATTGSARPAAATPTRPAHPDVMQRLRGGTPAAGRARLPRRRRAGHRAVPRADPRTAAAAGGRARGRQDRGGQGAGGGAGRAADPAAVLRGPDRQRGALRVELPAPAAGDPAGRVAARDAGRRGPVHRGVPAGAADPAGGPAHRPGSPRCCSSTRSTGPTTSSRRCCSSSSARRRSRSPRSARSPRPGRRSSC